MRAALIAPTQFLEYTQPYSDYHLILTHKVIYDAKYREFYAQRSKAGDFIILDNSAAEKNARSLPFKNIVLAAILTRPNVVILPDFLFDSDRTLDGLEHALRSPQMRFMRRVLPDTKLCAVAQGVDESDWLECFDILNSERNGLDYLAVPMLTTQIFGSRSGALRAISKRVRKPVHLLGFWHDTPLDEIYIEKTFNFVMGIDTSKPVKLAAQGKTLDDWLLLERDKEFVDRKHNGVNLDLLRANCRGFVEVCK